MNIVMEVRSGFIFALGGSLCKTENAVGYFSVIIKQQQTWIKYRNLKHKRGRGGLNFDSKMRSWHCVSSLTRLTRTLIGSEKYAVSTTFLSALKYYK